MHCWLFVSFLPTALVKMVHKSHINESYSLMTFSILILTLSLLHDPKSNLIACKWVEAYTLLSTIVHDALGNIGTRLELRKPDNCWNPPGNRDWYYINITKLYLWNLSPTNSICVISVKSFQLLQFWKHFKNLIHPWYMI